MKIIEDELLVKYFRKELSEQESAQIAAWLNADKANQHFLFGLEELYLASQYEEMEKMADTNNEWKKLEHSILNSPINKTLPKRSMLLGRILKYAAIVIIAFSLPYLLNFIRSHQSEETDTYATVITGRGERSQLILPDGTKVWLNTASTLSYSTNNSSNRKVKLSGEAYFDVEKDKYRPFIVETNLIKIKVLGTKFNLKDFQEEGCAEATLYEGSISANTPNGDFKQDIVLEPDQQLSYTQDKTLTVLSINNSYDREWKDGVHHFKKQSLANIAQSLERTFNVEITITDRNLAQQEFTCEFENAENLNDILEVLRMTGRITYDVEVNQITIKPKITQP